MSDQCNLVNTLGFDEHIEVQNEADYQFQKSAVPFPFPIEGSFFWSKDDEDDEENEETQYDRPADLSDEEGIEYPEDDEDDEEDNEETNVNSYEDYDKE